jgi:hypothetical protein
MELFCYFIPYNPEHILKLHFAAEIHVQYVSQQYAEKNSHLIKSLIVL